MRLPRADGGSKRWEVLGVGRDAVVGVLKRGGAVVGVKGAPED